MAVVGIDPELVDDLEVVFAPVLQVHQGVVQRRAIVAGEGIDAAQGLGGSEDIRRDDLIEQAGELCISKGNAIQSFELFPEVPLERGAVGDVSSVLVFQALELSDKCVLDVSLTDNRGFLWSIQPVWIGG